jgi:hypothetical protein
MLEARIQQGARTVERAVDRALEDIVLMPGALIAGVGGTVSAQSLPLAPVAAPGVRISVLAQGLRDPRGLDIAPGGDLYVAEAGTTPGIFTPPPGPAPGPALRTRCAVNWPVGPVNGGFTARISRVSSEGEVTTAADELPSAANNNLIGGDRMGIAAVTLVGGRLYPAVRRRLLTRTPRGGQSAPAGL